MDEPIEEGGSLLLSVLGSIAVVVTLFALYLNNGILARYIEYVINAGS